MSDLMYEGSFDDQALLGLVGDVLASRRLHDIDMTDVANLHMADFRLLRSGLDDQSVGDLQEALLAEAAAEVEVGSLVLRGLGRVASWFVPNDEPATIIRPFRALRRASGPVAVVQDRSLVLELEERHYSGQVDMHGQQYNFNHEPVLLASARKSTPGSFVEPQTLAQYMYAPSSRLGQLSFYSQDPAQTQPAQVFYRPEFRLAPDIDARHAIAAIAIGIRTHHGNDIRGLLELPSDFYDN